MEEIENDVEPNHTCPEFHNLDIESDCKYLLSSDVSYAIALRHFV